MKYMRCYKSVTKQENRDHFYIRRPVCTWGEKYDAEPNFCLSEISLTKQSVRSVSFGSFQVYQ
jgi:hypothetical protein